MLCWEEDCLDYLLFCVLEAADIVPADTLDILHFLHTDKLSNLRQHILTPQLPLASIFALQPPQNLIESNPPQTIRSQFDNFLRVRHRYFLLLPTVLFDLFENL